MSLPVSLMAPRVCTLVMVVANDTEDHKKMWKNILLALTGIMYLLLVNKKSYRLKKGQHIGMV